MYRRGQARSARAAERDSLILVKRTVGCAEANLIRFAKLVLFVSDGKCHGDFFGLRYRDLRNPSSRSSTR